MGSTGEVHVLMVTFPAQGHLSPLLKIAKRLVPKGIHVTIATLDYVRDRLLRSNNHSATLYTTAAASGSIDLKFFSDGFSLDFDRESNAERWFEALKTNGPKNLSALIANLAKERDVSFSCIISNNFMPWVTDVAEEQNIPSAVLWIQATAAYSVYYRYYKKCNDFPPLVENSREKIDLPGIPGLEVRDFPGFMFPVYANSFGRLVYDFVQKLDKVKWVLGSSFFELEEEVVNSMASLKEIIPIGPVVSPFLLGEEEKTVGNFEMYKAEDSCTEWLDNQAPASVVYISFGSILLLNQQQVDSISKALKNTERPFLWVVRSPAQPEKDKKDSEKKVGELSSEFLRETKDRGLVVTWCPQERVLMHPALSCFLTHCGWNSTMESVVVGLPVIAYPSWTDQPMDAKLLVDCFKIGVRMRNGDNGKLSVEEVERCLKEVSDGPQAAEMKKRAAELKEAARRTVRKGGSSDRNLEKFINEISSKSI
ncbi:UDP-glycosyltransferase 84B1-like [Carica papaya]|uniref:UDP-glycosyltransferase 84B1-like n=1 Tax=Carica papaya TaxID=3649 RepID=UPI000B8D18A1|nr:UDP-glycosyltransferase 84B1-like [Carica papaya]